MVINENNSQINSFTKGMNSDSAYDQIENTQYIFGKNIRITKNQLIGESQNDTYSTLHEGVVAPVPEGIFVSEQNIDGKILTVDSVDNLCTIITGEGNTLRVYRCKVDEITDEVSDFEQIWNAEVDLNKGVSTVLYKELENVIKLYIATGTTPIVTLRVDDESYKKYEGRSIDDLINNRIIPKSTVRIEKIIAGRLKTSQVQYTYRYYNKYGNTTQLAPLTNKIQVINQTKSKEIGCAEDTETSVGFQITIDTSGFVNTQDSTKNKFDRIQVYRLSYIKPQVDAKIDLIYDDVLPNSETFLLNDANIDPLQELTIDEFSAMSGLIVIPKVIGQNQEYMFASNVEDDTIIRDITVDSFNVASDLKLIEGSVVLSDGKDGVIPTTSENLYKNLSTYTIKQHDGNSSVPTITTSSYLEQRNINSENLGRATYNDIITSSLLRSLRRGGETYKYGIVFYDAQGRRSDVIELGDVETPIEAPFAYDNNKLLAKPLGVAIKIPQIETDADIIGCQIVRRSSSDIYQKTLLQVALARPISQYIYTTKISDVEDLENTNRSLSPYYPTGYLTTDNFRIHPGYYATDYTHARSENPTYHDYADYNNPSGKDNFTAITRNDDLFQIFSSEIDFRRDDVLQKLTQSETTLRALYSLLRSGEDIDEFAIAQQQINGKYWTDLFRWLVIPRTQNQKIKESKVFNYYETLLDSTKFINVGVDEDIKINNVKDVRIPNWEDGFSELSYNSDGEDDIYDGIKKYQTFTTGIGSYIYNNWVSFGKYDLRIGSIYQQNLDDSKYVKEFINHPGEYSKYDEGFRSSYEEMNPKNMLEAITWLLSTESSLQLVNTELLNGRQRFGLIGAGPSCFLMTLDLPEGYSTPYTTDASNLSNEMQTWICNIQHSTQINNYQSSEFVQYFGFGNYFSLEKNNGVYTSNGRNWLYVFDGDIYITPHELTTMYKTYNMQSRDTLPSTQIVNYVPLESKVNTYFDYGMNYLNTTSANLLYEPGVIEGVISQERPVHQYNMIYSDNDVSNDVFSLISTDKNETNMFKQRTYYSELKTNGEFIDNFLIFKPAAFIDVDSRYGQITNLLTDRNLLYYWQDNAFGKFSVNERSLINDQNGNTIMLGQAGILSRYDYISTKYGMRLYDFCATSAENGVYWVDINNKAIVVGNSNQAGNYGEQTNVQNIINGKIDTYIPKVDYDLQNNELMCKCLTNEQQMIFNIKYNIPTSIYTRTYDDILYIKNHMYGLLVNDGKVEFRRHNYINSTSDYLTPIKLEFIVNHATSTTKVFDNQQLIPIKRDTPLDVLDNTKFSFETDIVKKTEYKVEPYNDREGNITYAIPRYGNEAYGNRIRGKWLRVNIEEENPDKYFTISHIITKFRQSFS